MIRVLDIAILGLLMDRDHHGYEIRSQVRDRLAVSANISFGAIYPALNRLERQGLVEAVVASEPRVSALSTGSLSGERASLRSLRANQGRGRRSRKVYRITPRGREAFIDMLADPATTTPPVGWAFDGNCAAAGCASMTATAACSAVDAISPCRARRTARERS